MSISARSLWPEDIAITEGQVPPVAILKEQGSLLGQRTKNLVTGRVTTDQEAGTEEDRGSRHAFRYGFDLVAPALGYRYRLFSISHGVDFYPLTIHGLAFPRKAVRSREEAVTNKRSLAERAKLKGQKPGPQSEQTVDNEEEFLQALTTVFSSEETKRVISSLIAQSKA